MAALASLLAYRILFIGLGCLMLATLLYTIITDGSPFRRELFTPWMVATLIDFYANVVAIAFWVAYKETSWMVLLLWVILLVCFGSVVTCVYIVVKLFEISPQDLHNPVSRLLLRNSDEYKMKYSSVIFGRILFSVLGIFASLVVLYTVVTDGLPFRMELLTPWMAALLVDFYINIVPISIWVAHKEPSWLRALLWICLLICFGSITTCAYIVISLFQLSLEDPKYHILLDSNKKSERIRSSK